MYIRTETDNTLPFLDVLDSRTSLRSFMSLDPKPTVMRLYILQNSFYPAKNKLIKLRPWHIAL